MGESSAGVTGYFSFASAFLNNGLSLGQFEQAMYLGELGEQIVLKSEKAFEQIVFEKAIRSILPGWALAYYQWYTAHSFFYLQKRWDAMQKPSLTKVPYCGKMNAAQRKTVGFRGFALSMCKKRSEAGICFSRAFNEQEMTIGGVYGTIYT